MIIIIEIEIIYSKWLNGLNHSFENEIEWHGIGVIAYNMRAALHDRIEHIYLTYVGVWNICMCKHKTNRVNVQKIREKKNCATHFNSPKTKHTTILCKLHINAIEH